jgi:4a-hydroxytetrahydrobiopterin dehydratase
MDDLALQNCVPCRGGVPPLTPDEMAPLLARIGSTWRVVERADAKRGTIEILEKEYRYDDFAQAMAAALRVGELAEAQQHHPDLHIAWGRLRVEIWTHKIGGLTESDFIFAAKCDALLNS